MNHARLRQALIVEVDNKYFLIVQCIAFMRKIVQRSHDLSPVDLCVRLKCDRCLQRDVISNDVISVFWNRNVILKT